MLIYRSTLAVFSLHSALFELHLGALGLFMAPIVDKISKGSFATESNCILLTARQTINQERSCWGKE